MFFVFFGCLHFLSIFRPNLYLNETQQKNFFDSPLKITYYTHNNFNFVSSYGFDQRKIVLFAFFI